MTTINSNRQAFINTMLENPELERIGFDLLIKECPDFPSYFDALESAGLFNANRNRVPNFTLDGEKSLCLPFWEALPYLKAIAKWTGENNDINLASKLLKIVREVSKEHHIDGKTKESFHTWNFFAEILALVPTNTITDTDIELIYTWLNVDFPQEAVGSVLVTQLLPKLLASSDPSDWRKACRVLCYSLTTRIVSNYSSSDVEESVSVIGDYWLEELLNKNKRLLSEKCAKEASMIFHEKLQEVFSRIESRVPSWSVRPAIEEHSQNYKWKGVENCLVEGLRDIVDSWLKAEPEVAKEVVKGLLAGKLQIERRIAIYLINRNFEETKALISEAIPLLCESNYLHELYVLLENSFIHFEDTQKKMIVKAIQELPSFKNDENNIIKKRSQRNWLNAIKGKGFPEADKLFEELNADPNLGLLSSHPSFISWSESWVGPGPSPYQVSEILSFLDASTLVDKLNDFSETEDHWSDAPTISALVNTLEDAVTIEPHKFILILKDFQNANWPYKYGIINGFKKLWATTKAEDIDSWENIWDKLLSFMENILLSRTFWKQPSEKTKNLTPDKSWIPRLVADFLRMGLNNDNKSIHPKFLPRVQTLLCKLVEKLQSTWTQGEKDAMTQAINSEKGRAIEALVNYALFIARQSDKRQREHQSAWEEVEQIFTTQLDLCKGQNFEFSTLMGSYFVNIEYLSFDWLNQHLKQIFPIEYRDNFVCAISGLAYAPASKRGYNLLRDEGIIQIALETDIGNEHIRENLLQRVALAYIQGEESLDSKNIKFILQSGSANDLKEIIGFFWSVHEQNLEKEHIERILAFWKECNRWVNHQKATASQLLSMMGLLISYLNIVSSEQKEWLLMSVPHIAANQHTYFFLKELDRLADVNPEIVRDLLSKMLETYNPYVDSYGHLKSIVCKLAKGRFKGDALLLTDKLRNIEEFQHLYVELNSI